MTLIALNMSYNRVKLWFQSNVLHLIEFCSVRLSIQVMLRCNNRQTCNTAMMLYLAKDHIPQSAYHFAKSKHNLQKCLGRVSIKPSPITLVGCAFRALCHINKSLHKHCRGRDSQSNATSEREPKLDKCSLPKAIVSISSSIWITSWYYQ